MENRGVGKTRWNAQTRISADRNDRARDHRGSILVAVALARDRLTIYAFMRKTLREGRNERKLRNEEGHPSLFIKLISNQARETRMAASISASTIR